MVDLAMGERGLGCISHIVCTDKTDHSTLPVANYKVVEGGKVQDGSIPHAGRVDNSRCIHMKVRYCMYLVDTSLASLPL